MENSEHLEQMKKQWEAMGLDPNQMMQFMNNAMQMQQQTHDVEASSLEDFMDKFSTNEDAFDLFEEAPQFKENSALTEAVTKALYCSSNISFHGNLYVNTISTFLPQKDILYALEESWGINSKDEFINMLEWLSGSGHKIYFDLIWDKIITLPQAEWRLGIESLKMLSYVNDEIDVETIDNFFRNILETYPVMSSQGLLEKNLKPNIAAWDLQRAMLLCRFGCDVDYFTHKEAEHHILKLAKKMYECYDSWNSLSAGYLVGYGMWSGDEDSLEDYLEQQTVLFNHEKSPWNIIKWKSTKPSL